MQASLAGEPLITVAKNQQYNERPNFRFGETKIAIAHTINRLPRTFCALDTVRVE